MASSSKISIELRAHECFELRAALIEFFADNLKTCEEDVVVNAAWEFAEQNSTKLQSNTTQRFSLFRSQFYALLDILNLNPDKHLMLMSMMRIELGVFLKKRNKRKKQKINITPIIQL